MNTSKPDPHALVKGLTKVASLPSIFSKVEEALANPKSSNKLLADILSEDTALSARLLRLANSAFYNFPGKVDTITQAIIVIGTHQLRDVVLASCVVSAFKDIPDDIVNMDSFWRHSIACGVTCRILATLRRDPNIETAFLSGLLHDIGSLVLYKMKPEEMGILLSHYQESKQLLFKLEREHFGFDHALLGGLLLKEWELPERHQETTTYHHSPGQSKIYPLETAMVHISDIIANAVIDGSSGERIIPPLNPTTWEKLGLNDSSASFIINELNNQFSIAVSFVSEDT